MQRFLFLGPARYTYTWACRVHDARRGALTNAGTRAVWSSCLCTSKGHTLSVRSTRQYRTPHNKKQESGEGPSSISYSHEGAHILHSFLENDSSWISQFTVNLAASLSHYWPVSYVGVRYSYDIYLVGCMHVLLFRVHSSRRRWAQVLNPTAVYFILARWTRLSKFR